MEEIVFLKSLAIVLVMVIVFLTGIIVITSNRQRRREEAKRVDDIYDKINDIELRVLHHINEVKSSHKDKM